MGVLSAQVETLQADIRSKDKLMASEVKELKSLLVSSLKGESISHETTAHSWRDDFQLPMTLEPDAFCSTGRSKEGKDRATEHQFFCSQAFKNT